SRSKPTTWWWRRKPAAASLSCIPPRSGSGAVRRYRRAPRCGQQTREDAHSLALRLLCAIGRPPLNSSVHPMTDPSRAHADVANLFPASLAESDPELADAIGHELARQRDEIELIASENIVSRAVLEAQGSVLTNKYAEGLPGRRYYGGCQYVDVAENLALDRVKKLFGVQFANVQPHSGASANVAAFMALMQPGDTFLGLNLA